MKESSNAEVSLNINDGMLQLKYMVVCDPSVLTKPDINMLVLFGIAVSIIYFAFHTPELQMVLEMTDDEIEETEFKSTQAVGFCFAASGMLLFLYFMVDKIYWLLEIGISIVSAVACSTVIQELFTHRKFFRRIFTEEDS